jgi:hypothetical protein
MIKRLLPVLVLLVFLAVPSYSQDARATIEGTVRDSGGSVLAGATVTATNTATGVKIATKVNDAGIYQIPYLLPGIYDISSEASGFKTFVQSGFELRISDRAKLDILMEVGQVSQTVTVTGQSSLLQAESASTSTTIEKKTIVDAPVSGGDVGTLVLLSPGVTDVAIANHPYELTSVNVASRIVVSGVRSQNTEFTVDGTPAMSNDSAAFVPAVDLVQEVKVETNSYDASYGHSAGGYFNTITRSGTNSFHGSLYEFHTDAALLSMNLFQRNQYNNPNSLGPPTKAKYLLIKGRDVNNRFGGSIGGPVIIPKLYNGRDKTFWIFGYEGFRHPSTDANSGSIFTVPSLAERGGDFSALLPAGCPTASPYNSTTTLCGNGTPSSYQIYDPNTTVPAGNGLFMRTPFPGNILPVGRLDATAKTYLNYYPLPNQPATTPQGQNNYFHPVRSLSDYDQITARVDHVFNEKERIFGRFNYGTLNGLDNYAFSNAATQYYNYAAITGAAIDNVYVFNPSFLIDVRYGFLRRAPSSKTPAVDLTTLGISSSVLSQIPVQGRTFPKMTIDGGAYQTAGPNPPTQGPNTNDNTVTVDMTKSFGKHTLRFGPDFRVYQANNYNLSNSSPFLTFASTYTNGPLSTAPAAAIGQGLASLLLGIPTAGTIIVNTSYAYTSRYYGAYLQDDFQVTPRVTISAGIRYEYESATTERFNRSVKGFDPTAASPISSTAIANYNANPIPQIPVGQFKVNGGLTFAGVGGNSRALWAADPNNFAPRIGVTFQPDSATVFRGGYGIFYMPKGADRFGTAQDRVVVNQLGFSQVTTFVPTIDNGQHFIANLDNLFPSGLQQPTGAAGGLNTGLGGSVSYYNPQQINPLIQRWSFGFQRELPKHILFEMSYVGSSGRSLGVTPAQDAVPRQYLSTSPTRDQATINLLSSAVSNPFYPLLPGTSLSGSTVSRSQLLMPYPQFTAVTHNAPLGSSIYHALDVQAVRRFANGFSIQGTYTFSKFLQSTEFLNASDPLPTQVISDQDIPQRFTLTGIYDIPVGRGRRFGSSMNRFENALLGGWQFATIWAGQSGTPLGFGNPLFTGDVGNITLPNSQKTAMEWFNINAGFDKNAADQLADNIQTFPLRLPNVRTIGINNANASAMKYFNLWEGAKFQFRCEAMNAANHSQFAAPNTTPTSSLFGQIASVQSIARQIFFSGKIIF